MAKSTQPKGKLVRRFGVNIFDHPKYDRLLERRGNPPGQHGGKSQRHKVSGYGLQLLEKQKLRQTYGLLEKQFRRTFQRALQQPGVTGENLLVLLESRLDNAVFRAGFAATRSQARQLVSHGHFSVNGSRVDIASCQLRIGDRVSVKEKSQPLISRCRAQRGWSQEAAWLTVDEGSLSFALRRLPLREELPAQINEQLIVELYSR